MTEQLQVSELFYSIQGESTLAGLPCLFVRLAGCNLRCVYCDARYTWEEKGTAMDVVEILRWIEKYPGVMVEITGGEPLCQTATYPLMRILTDTGRTVMLETNGSLPLNDIPDQVRIIMDVKCPDSGMADHNLPDNLDLLRQRARRRCRDEIKYVLSSETDFHWARGMVEREQHPSLIPRLFSPVQPQFAPAVLAQLIMEYRLPVRLQIQLHTLLWPGQTRGV